MACVGLSNWCQHGCSSGDGLTEDVDSPAHTYKVPREAFEFLLCYILRGQKKVSDSLELELRAAVYLQHGFWEPNDCSTIAVYVLRPWAISPATRLEDLLMSCAFNFGTLKVEAVEVSVCEFQGSQDNIKKLSQKNKIPKSTT